MSNSDQLVEVKLFLSLIERKWLNHSLPRKLLRFFSHEYLLPLGIYLLS